MLVCHDLKFEADPVAPPLPNGLRMIPVLFYIAIAGCAFFTAYFMIQKNASERGRLAQERVTAEEKKKIAQVQMKYNDLEGAVKKASSMIAWVKGSTPIQRLAMTINNSVLKNSEEMGGDSTIRTLKLSRKQESPWQIKLALTLNGSDPEGLNVLLEELGNGAEKYKRFNPQRSVGEASVNYTATLIRSTEQSL